MKKIIISIITVLLFTIGLTGCGNSGSTNNLGPQLSSLASVKVSLTENGKAVEAPDSIALYTNQALMKEGIGSSVNSSFRASVVSQEGVYKPVNDCGNGEFLFTVPSGDYTLVAVKGSSKTVTAVRASADTILSTSASLTPTGKITGIATVSGASSYEGIFVYLKNTSFVAITDAKGSFVIDGVPSGEAYNICGLLNAQGKTYYSEQSVSIATEKLTAEVVLSLTDATDSYNYNVTGKIVSDSSTDFSTDLSNQVVMITGGKAVSITKFALTDKNGEFTFNINSEGIYTVTVLGNDFLYTPSMQQITLDSDKKITLDDFKVKSNGYGCVSLSINNTSPKETNVEFLVRLIGASGTYYCTQTRVSSNPGNNNVEVEFTGIPAGTYSVLVDPEDSGYFGSSSLFEVKAGVKIQVPVVVSDITPVIDKVYVASSSSDNLGQIVINGQKGQKKVVISPNGSFNFEDVYNKTIFISLFDEKTNKPIKYNNLEEENSNVVLSISNEALDAIKGDLSVVASKRWYDDVSNRSGIVNFKKSLNITPSEISLKDLFEINTIDTIDFSSVEYENSGFSLTLYNSDRGIIGRYYINSVASYSEIKNENENEKIIAFEGKYYVTATPEYDNTEYHIYSFDGLKNTFSGVTYSSDLDSVHICDNYISINCLKTEIDPSVSNDATSVTRLYNLSGKLLASFENTTSSCCGNFAKNGTDTFICVLKQDSTDKNSKINIYAVNDSIDVNYPVVSVEFTFDYKSINKFVALSNTSFIVEFIDDKDFCRSFLVTSNSALEIIGGRRYFHKDKYGYLYCLDGASKKILKLTNVNGRPVATSKVIDDIIGFVGQCNDKLYVLTREYGVDNYIKGCSVKALAINNMTLCE